jgi:hypothetical protein
LPDTLLMMFSCCDLACGTANSATIDKGSDSRRDALPNSGDSALRNSGDSALNPQIPLSYSRPDAIDGLLL